MPLLPVTLLLEHLNFPSDGQLRLFLLYFYFTSVQSFQCLTVVVIQTSAIQISSSFHLPPYFQLHSSSLLHFSDGATSCFVIGTCAHFWYWFCTVTQCHDKNGSILTHTTFFYNSNKQRALLISLTCGSGLLPMTLKSILE